MRRSLHRSASSRSSRQRPIDCSGSWRAASARSSAVSGSGSSTVRWPILRPGAGRPLAVEVERDARIAAQGGVPPRLAAGLGPQVAEQVDHRRRHHQVGRAQRQAAEGAHLLLELAGDGRLDRQVPRVVRARGDLVDQQPAVGGQEELDGQRRRRSPAPGPTPGPGRAPPGRRSGRPGPASPCCRGCAARGG